MKSLILLLYLGAVVLTLAENPFEDKAVQEYVDAGEGETIAELADEDRPCTEWSSSKMAGEISSLVSIFKQATGMWRISLICLRFLQRPYKIGSKQSGKVPQQVL